MALYHKDIGFPDYIKLPSHTVDLQYSNHARQAAANDRYGVIKLPYSVNLATAELIEIELEGKTPVKMLLRTKYSTQYDLCIVLAPGGVVKTVWLNDKTDTHTTLKKHLYCVPK